MLEIDPTLASYFVGSLFTAIIGPIIVIYWLSRILIKEPDNNGDSDF